MSGGVDSSVAAALLVRGGLAAVGITMDLGTDDGMAPEPPARDARRCCGLPDADDARTVAQALGIPHYIANYREAFREAVIEPFVEAYARGETPIPCVPCNRFLKFDLLLRRARSLGARGVATGHYAGIGRGPDGTIAVHRARDRQKDQSYFLFDLTPEVLEEVRFPVGDRTKTEVREVARELGLVTWDKAESRGICFVPDGDVRAALGRLRKGLRQRKGEVVDGEGRTLGSHDGAVGYTLGQRKGLGLASGPWYVSDVDPQRNVLIVDREAALWRRTLRLRSTFWISGSPPEGSIRVQVRHQHRSVPARVEAVHNGEVVVRLEEPVWAPAPGQAGVVYDDADVWVLGGGWIAGSA
jgi:tRNA-specific 2-thiouridylase